MKPTWKHAALGAAAFLLASLAWLGINGGVHEIPEGTTTGQKVQAWTQLGYGILSAAVLLTAFWIKGVKRTVRVLWLVIITLSGGLAPVVWGESSVFVGLLAAGTAILMGWGILKLLDIGTPRRVSS